MRLIDGDILLQDIIKNYRISNRVIEEIKDIIAAQEEIAIDEPKYQVILNESDPIWCVTKDYQMCGRCGENVAPNPPTYDVRQHIALWKYCPRCGAQIRNALVEI